MSDFNFAELAKSAGQKVTRRTTLRIIPESQKPIGKRDGKHLPHIAQEAADRFYKNGVEVAKVVFTRIDADNPNRETDDKERNRHQIRMAEARKILQEQRNVVFYDVLPLFDVALRSPGDEWTEADPNSFDGQSADKHVQDYIVRNAFYMMTKAYCDYLPILIKSEEVDSVRQVILSRAETLSDKLASELRNYKFNFRRIAAPGKK